MRNGIWSLMVVAALLIAPTAHAQDIDTLEAAVEAAAQALAENQALIDELKASRAELKAELQEYPAGSDERLTAKAALNAVVSDLRAAREDKDSLVEAHRSARDALRTAKAEAREAEAEEQREYAALQADLADAQAALETAQAALDTARAENVASQAEIAALQTQVTEAEARATQAEQTLLDEQTALEAALEAQRSAEADLADLTEASAEMLQEVHSGCILFEDPSGELVIAANEPGYYENLAGVGFYLETGDSVGCFPQSYFFVKEEGQSCVEAAQISRLEGSKSTLVRRPSEDDMFILTGKRTHQVDTDLRLDSRSPGTWVIKSKGGETDHVGGDLNDYETVVESNGAISRVDAHIAQAWTIQPPTSCGPSGS